MGNFIALIVFGCFCVLASYAYGTTQAILSRHAKPVILIRSAWKNQKAEIIADVWNISPNELDTAQNIFGR